MMFKSTAQLIFLAHWFSDKLKLVSGDDLPEILFFTTDYCLKLLNVSRKFGLLQVHFCVLQVSLILEILLMKKYS